MTPSGLYRELRRIAFINQDFRMRHTGSFHINVEQGEPIHLADFEAGSIEEWEVGDKWPQPRLVESYYFQGRRVEVGETQNVLEFNYSYTNAFRGIRLPRHIAEYAFRGITDGGVPVDPVEAAGPSTIEQTLEFDIASNDLDLTARETVTYYDHEGEQVARTSSMLDPHDENAMTVMPPTSLLEDDDNDDLLEHDRDHSKPINLDELVDPRAPTSFYNDAADYLERYLGEPDPENPDNLVFDKIGAPTLDEIHSLTLDIDTELRDLVLANQVLTSMKKAFRRQLGMQL